jgi:hypothetical protein
VALGVLTVVTVLALVAAAAAITSNHQSFRDRNSKRSYQAASAGLQTANYQTTLLQPGLQQCVVKDPLTGALSVASVQADGWCAPQVENLADGSSYAEQVSAGTLVDSNGQTLVVRKIVSTGTVNGVTRRIAMTSSATTAMPLFPHGYAAVSLAPIDWGNTVKVTGKVGSNGDIQLGNQAEICGDATPGPDGQVTTSGTAHVCGGYSTTAAQQPFALDPVNQGNARTQNDNIRITNALSAQNPKPAPTDACTSCGGVSWSESARVLELSGSATLTLGGGVYSFCKVTLRNSAQLKVAANATVKIYVDGPDPGTDPPSGCTGTGMGSVTLNNVSGIVNLNSSPTTLQLYMVGSPTVATTLDLANAFTSNILMAVYAPYSTVYMHNFLRVIGAVAAKTVQMQNDTQITYDPRVADIRGGSIPLYRSTRDSVECTSKPTGAAVDSGC